MAPPKRPPPRKAEEPEFEFEILPARELSASEAIVLLVLGPPKVGKSHLLSSLCAEGKSLLISTLAREASSEGYQKHNPDVIRLSDPGWRPSRGKFDATAYTRFLELMETLADDDEYKVVLLDSGTELGEFAWHEALRPFGVASPADMEDKDNRFRPYTKIADLMRQALDALLLLKEAPLPKHVGIAWHLQNTKDDQVVFDQAKQAKVTKASADSKGESVEYMGSVLPMMQGGFRRKIAALADAVVYSHVQYERVPRVGKPGSDQHPKYVIQIVPDEERHAGIPAIVPAGMTFIPNEWKSLKKLLVENPKPKEGK